MSRLDALVDDELSKRLEAHREAWPDSRRPLDTLSGRAIAGLLDGTGWSTQQITEEQQRLVIPGLSAADEEALVRLLPDPGPRTWLPTSVSLVPRLVDPGVSHVGQVEPLGQLIPTGAARLARLIVAPVLTQLLGCWRLRTETGLKTLKGRLAVVHAATHAHVTLGLEPAPSEALLDPNLDAAQLAELRHRLAEAWSRRPEDFADRVLLLLTSELARTAIKKRRRDGTIREVDVLTTRLRPLCEATLGSWDALVEYLGVGSSAAARPQSVAVQPPDVAPPEIVERLSVLRAWWEHADAAWAAQPAGAPTLWGMTPARRHPGERVLGPSDHTHPTPAFAGSPQAAALWGTRTDKRAPEILVPEADPMAAMAEILGAPYAFWEGIALTVYYLTHGPYSRTSLEDASVYYDRQVAQLAAADAPVDPTLWADLTRAAGNDEARLRSPGSISIQITVDAVGGSQDSDSADSLQLASAFTAMRDVTTRHRRDWASAHLMEWLDATWQSDFVEAGSAYAQKTAERDGRPPTLKQAWPLVGPTANRWFAGDYSRLAASLGLTGPIATPPSRTSRTLPEDMDAMAVTVARALDGDPMSRDWPTRRRGEVAGRTLEALEYWVVTGDAPAPRAIGVSGILDVAWPDDPEAGYARFIVTLGKLLSEQGHPAAAVFAAAGAR